MAWQTIDIPCTALCCSTDGAWFALSVLISSVCVPSPLVLRPQPDTLVLRAPQVRYIGSVVHYLGVSVSRVPRRAVPVPRGAGRGAGRRGRVGSGWSLQAGHGGGSVGPPPRRWARSSSWSRVSDAGTSES